MVVLAFFGNTILLLTCLMVEVGRERYARIIRRLAVSANNQGYTAVFIQLGAKPSRFYIAYILPNIVSTLIISLALTFPQIILLESRLSFFRPGVQPPMSGLGSMSGFGKE